MRYIAIVATTLFSLLLGAVAVAQPEPPMVQLTTNPAEDYSPAWSPDGTQIAFTSNRGDPFNSHIWVMPATGEPATQLSRRPRVLRGLTCLVTRRHPDRVY